MKIYLTYRERVAGFFILVTLTIVLLFIVGAAVENLWFTPKISYRIYVSEGEGLSKGSTVFLSGVEVGKVGELLIRNDGRINVELKVLQKYAPQIIKGTRAKIKRSLGIGEKRVFLYLPQDTSRPVAIAPEGVIPVDENKDILDVLATIDLGKYMETMDRVVNSLDLLMVKLDEDERMVRILEAFDNLGPTLQTMNQFFKDIDEPFVTLINDPSIHRAFKGGAKVFNDKKTRQLIHALADSIEPEKVKNMLEQSEQLVNKLDSMLEPEGHVQKTFKGTDKLLNDGRLDKMLKSMDNLTDEQQIKRLMRNMTILSTQMAKIGPEIPGMAKEMNRTMHELTIVLKALQKTWLLDDETEQVLKKMKKDKKRK